MKHSKFLSLFFALSLVLSGCSKEENSTPTEGESVTSAEEMRLEDFTGNVTLENQNQEKAVVLGSRLVTGDNLETLIESDAYVVLDQSKVLRVNETSQVEIQQDDSHLDIYLTKGSIFFNVTTTLSSEETLEFHTNNVVTGVRGTSGIIHFDPENQVTQIVVLSGVVSGTTSEEEQNIEAGQMAIVKTLEDGTVEMTIYTLHEEDPLYYFSDMFIDGIQGELDFLDGSLILSEMVRLPNNAQYLAIYEPIIQQYRDFLFNGVEVYETENDAIMWMGLNWGDYSLSVDQLKVGYELLDIDGNGVPELLIYHSDRYEHDNLNYMREVFTIQNGEPHCLLQADTRYLISVREGGILQGGYASYDWETLGFDDLTDYHSLEDSYMIPLHDMDFSNAPPEIPISKLTIITAEIPQTGETTETTPTIPSIFGGEVTLPDNITVFGENRNLSTAQAEGFATALRGLETTPTHIALVDNGEYLVMLAGSYNANSMDAMVMSYVPVDLTVILWNGNQVEISPTHEKRSETYYTLCEENSGYFIRTEGFYGSDGGGYMGTFAFDVENRYFLETGLFGTNQPYHYMTADGTEEMRERLTDVTGDSLADCALSVSEYRFRGQDMTFMSEALAQQGNTVESYLVRNGSIELVSEVPTYTEVLDLEDQNATLWNSYEAVMTAFES